MKGRFIPRIILLIIALIFTVSAFSVSAAQTKFHFGFGTEKSGITCGKMQIWHNDATEGPKNLDFTEGFKYWGTQSGVSPAKLGEIATVGGETVYKFRPTEQNDIVLTTPFSLTGITPDTKISVVYDWRGEGIFNIQLNQVDKGWLATYPDNKVVSPDPNGWNTSLAMPVGKFTAETDPTFAVCIMATDSQEFLKDFTVEIKNIRLVTVSAMGEVKEIGTGKIVDFEQPEDTGDNTDGNITSSENTSSNEDEFNDTDSTLGNLVSDNNTGLQGNNNDSNLEDDETAANGEKEPDGISTSVLILICVGVVSVVIVITAVITFYIAKRKFNK